MYHLYNQNAYKSGVHPSGHREGGGPWLSNPVALTPCQGTALHLRNPHLTLTFSSLTGTLPSLCSSQASGCGLRHARLSGISALSLTGLPERPLLPPVNLSVLVAGGGPVCAVLPCRSTPLLP